MIRHRVVVDEIVCNHLLEQVQTAGREGVVVAPDQFLVGGRALANEQVGADPGADQNHHHGQTEPGQVVAEALLGRGDHLRLGNGNA